MEPVVNGLEKNYGGDIDIRWLDANRPDGGAAFLYYQVVGHPSYVILDPDGQILWIGLGELSEAQLSQQIADILVRP